METGERYVFTRFLYGEPTISGFCHYAYDDYPEDEVEQHESDLIRWGITYKKVTVENTYPIDF